MEKWRVGNPAESCFILRCTYGKKTMEAQFARIGSAPPRKYIPMTKSLFCPKELGFHRQNEIVHAFCEAGYGHFVAIAPKI